MEKIVFKIKENQIITKGKCSIIFLAKSLPSIQQSLLKRLGQGFDQKVSATLLFIAVITALDELKVPRDVVMKAFDEAIESIKEAKKETVGES